MSPSAKIETMTPSKARKILENNKNNRPLRELYVLELANAMQVGEWQLNGESIKIDCNGNLQDGQHRLHAVVESKVSIQTMVVRNLPPNVFDTIDRGRVRTMSDVLDRHGYKDCTALAGALSWAHKYSQGCMTQSGRGPRPRAPQVLDLAKRHRGMERSVSIGRKSLLGPSLGAFCHYAFSKQNASKADEFFARLADGENIRKTQAVYKLRERLQANARAKAKLPPPEIAAIAIKAFNSACNGDNVGILRWGVKEDFPMLNKVPAEALA